MLKQGIQQKLGQKINPLQIQLIKLLELPTYLLEQRIKEEIEQNPLLEEGEETPDTELEVDYGQDDSSQNDNNEDSATDNENQDDLQEENNEDDYSVEEEFSLEDYIEDDETPDYRLSISNASKDSESRDFVFQQGSSFRESLIAQLGTNALSELEHRLAEYIIGCIDDDGYLRRDIESIVDDLAFGAGVKVTEEQVLRLLGIIQRFEPIGVGARDLRECLILQVNHKLRESSQNKQMLRQAKRILENCFEDFSRKHYEKLASKLRLKDESLRLVIDEILKLNPKPGGLAVDFSYGQETEKIIPDFTLDMEDGDLQLNLNSGDVPALKINKSYLNILTDYQNGETSKNKSDVVTFVKYKLSSAMSFIDAVQQRNNTLMLTMTTIVQFQKQFFMTGDSSLLRPMILKDIADITGLDVSTISRVSNSKHIQTWFGIYALKNFFTGSMQTASGKEVSTGELKSLLKQFVEDEDKKKPLTDDELVSLMEQKGYQIARRTIAKYRQIQNIPVARLRREV